MKIVFTSLKTNNTKRFIKKKVLYLTERNYNLAAKKSCTLSISLLTSQKLSTTKLVRPQMLPSIQFPVFTLLFQQLFDFTAKSLKLIFKRLYLADKSS